MSRSVFVWIRILSSSYGLSSYLCTFCSTERKIPRNLSLSQVPSYISPKNSRSQNKIRKQLDISLVLFWESQNVRFFASHLIPERQDNPSDFPYVFTIIHLITPFSTFHNLTLFENHHNVAFEFFNCGISRHFFPIKSELSGNTIWPQALAFQKLAKLTIFGMFDELLSSENIEWDFFCDLQTPWVSIKTI